MKQNRVEHVNFEKIILYALDEIRNFYLYGREEQRG